MTCTFHKILFLWSNQE